MSVKITDIKYCRDQWFKGKTLDRWVDMGEHRDSQITSRCVYLLPNVFSFILQAAPLCPPLGHWGPRSLGAVVPVGT